MKDHGASATMAAGAPNASLQPHGRRMVRYIWTITRSLACSGGGVPESGLCYIGVGFASGREEVWVFISALFQFRRSWSGGMALVPRCLMNYPLCFPDHFLMSVAIDS